MLHQRSDVAAETVENSNLVKVIHDTYAFYRSLSGTLESLVLCDGIFADVCADSSF